MEEQKWNGDTVPINSPTQQQFNKALEDPENKMVALHKPGSIIRHPSGAKYRVDKNGHWQKLPRK